MIPSSELIINADGSVFHLHLRPADVADIVILVGDPGRVEQVARYFDSREVHIANREFVTVTGRYGDRRMTVCSTGIGTDNIDIVATELDALVNVNLETRTARTSHRRLTLLRLGTCGALQEGLKIGDLVFSRTSADLGCLLDFYADSERVRNLPMERALEAHTGRRMHCIDASAELAELFADTAAQGITVSAPGFYGPQGRAVRLQPADPHLNGKLESFAFDGLRVTNMEMESSAVAGLGRLLGHRCGTLCTVVAQREKGDADTDYRPFVERMIKMSLDKLVALK
jgi:uridine phosphorylase